MDTEKACLRAKDLTRQLLAFARGGLPVKKPLALEPQVRESTRLILQDANVPYRLNWPEALPPVNADAEQLHQLLYELLTNAMHATPLGGAIHVRGELVKLDEESTLPLPKGEYVRLSVRDEGRGIPASQMPRVFEPFFTTKEHARGLGLATCFLIARNHDGFMTVDSAPRLRHDVLPVPARAARPPRRTAPPLERPVSMRSGRAGVGRGRCVRARCRSRPEVAGHPARAGDGRRETPICELAAELLGAGRAMHGRHGGGRRGGHPAATGRRWASGQPYDVVILDMTVRGGMGGRETVQRLLKIDPAVRAIVSSGYSQDATMSRYRDFGFCGVVRQAVQRFGTDAGDRAGDHVRLAR